MDSGRSGYKELSLKTYPAHTFKQGTNGRSAQVMLPQATITQDNIKPVLAIIQKAQELQEPKEKLYIIKEGDTLTSIAEANKSSVARLWAKNIQLTNPDQLNVSDPLKIPEDNEILAERPLPITVILPVQPTTLPSAGGVSNSGNSRNFPYGWCTYFASQQRPDVPVRGNAADWLAWSNSTTPAIGAIAVNTQGLGHVAIVRAIGDGKILVEHMNWRGFGVVSEDWIDDSYWSGYIL